MPGGNGSRDDNELHRLIEAGFGSVPKTVRKNYDRHELVNDIFLVMKSRGVYQPKKIQIRLASIDIHRRNTHHPRTWNHPHHQKRHRKVFLESSIAVRPMSSDGGRRGRTPGIQDLMVRDQSSGSVSAKAEIVEALRDIRRRFGTDGLAVFLMTRVMEINARNVATIMDFEPESALGKSLTSIGGSS